MVTLKELKAHLRIEHDDEDCHLKTLLKMAQAAAGDFCKTALPGKPPEAVRLAVLLYASHFYTHRENSDAGAYDNMLRAFHALLWPHRDTTKLV